TDVEGVSSHGEMHVRPDGYIGIAPLPGDVVNVCVVRELKNAFRAQRVNADTVVHLAVRGDALLAPRFVRARQVSEVTALGPLAVDCKAVGYPGLLLAGDAAGFIDPMTGDGRRLSDHLRRDGYRRRVGRSGAGCGAHHRLRRLCGRQVPQAVGHQRTWKEVELSSAGPARRPAGLDGTVRAPPPSQLCGR